MGFWKDLMDANPHKSMERASELTSRSIKSVIELPSILSDKAKECSICKMRFGKTFAKNAYPCLVTLETRERLSFSSTNQVIVCDACARNFGLLDLVR